ncbi:MAG: glycosyltransferase family 9 protein [Pseudomonadota bacterium]|nr:glycosyltransferase family 9 protein [Pseudomonadota bacterium]
MKNYSQEKKVLIIKFGGLGDVILSLNAINSIIEHHKKRKITLLTEEPYKTFFEKSGWFNDIVEIERTKFYMFDRYQIKKRLSVNSFSNVYDLQTSRRSSSYLKIFFNLKIETCGIGQYASLCHVNNSRNKMHTIERQEDQLRVSGITSFLEPDLKWLFKAGRIKKPKKRYALIVPGGSKGRMNKRVPLQIYLELISFLEKKNILPVILGANDDQIICDKIELQCPKVKNLCSKTDIFQIAKLAKNALVSFGNDTGPMHVISKGDRPTFVFFTKFSEPKLCAPRGNNVRLFYYNEQYRKEMLFNILKELGNVTNAKT